MKIFSRFRNLIFQCEITKSYNHRCRCKNNPLLYNLRTLITNLERIRNYIQMFLIYLTTWMAHFWTSFVGRIRLWTGWVTFESDSFWFSKRWSRGRIELKPIECTSCLYSLCQVFSWAIVIYFYSNLILVIWIFSCHLIFNFRIFFVRVKNYRLLFSHYVNYKWSKSVPSM